MKEQGWRWLNYSLIACFRQGRCSKCASIRVVATACHLIELRSYASNCTCGCSQVISAAVTTAEGSQLKKQIQELKLAIEKLLI